MNAQSSPSPLHNASTWLKTCIGTVFGVGFLPKMPGTFGSAITFLPTFFPLQNAPMFFLAVAGIAFVLGLWAIPALEERWGNDPSRIVIDEVMGMSLVLASPMIPHSPLWLFLAFILFRAFDIVKPFPINRANARRGALFVMLDDGIASFYAVLLLHGIWLMSQQFGLH